MTITQYLSGSLLPILPLLLLAGCARLTAAPLDFTLNVTPAASLDLSGEWRVAKDPANVGKTSKWFRGERRGKLNWAF